MCRTTSRSTLRTSLLSRFLLVFLSLLPVAITAATVYTLDDLGVLPGHDSSVALGINENGDVVGWSNGPSGAFPFLYTDATGMVQLAAFPGGSSNGVARDVNDSGLVVGQLTNLTGSPHAIRWTGGVPEDLGAIPNVQFSEAMGINASGDVTGDNGITSITGTQQAFIYVDPGPIDVIPLPIDRGRGRDINDSGQVTGYMTGAGNRAFRWSATGGTQDLGVVGGFAHSFGFAINNNGQVVGTLTSATGNTEHVFRDTPGIDMVDLGGYGELNSPLGINNHGDFVGHGRPTPSGLKRGFIYIDSASPLVTTHGLTTGLQGVTTLLDPALNWFVLYAYDINDAGTIAGIAINNDTGKTHAVRLRLSSNILPPAAPLNLAAAVINANRIDLDWIDNSNNESGFEIEQRDAGGVFAKIATTGKDVNSFIDATVSGGTTYIYRVRAVNPGGVSAFSNTTSGTTPIEDNEAPSVGFIKPLDGVEISGRVAIEINATDNIDVALVRLFVDNVLKCESTTSPLICTWNTKKVPLGAHSLMAWASDATGNVAQQVISVTLVKGTKGGGSGGDTGDGGSEKGRKKCNDGIDNDGDGLIDGADPDCN
jgi:probable HAF family extracellular repeat protein